MIFHAWRMLSFKWFFILPLACLLTAASNFLAVATALAVFAAATHNRICSVVVQLYETHDGKFYLQLTLP